MRGAEEERVEARVARLFEPVLRDVAACAELVLRVQDDYQPPAGSGGPVDEDMLMVWMPNGSGTGVRINDAGSELEQLADLSDQVHEAVVEGRWSEGLSTSWPPCPSHPDRHPLNITIAGTAVVWACPSSGQVLCPVGQLTC